MTKTQRTQLVEEYLQNMRKMWMCISGGKESVLSKYGIGMAQMKILYTLSHAKQITTSQIATDMMTSNSAVTQIVDTLVELDYVERVPSIDDRRVIFIQFTESGYTKFLEVKKVHIESVEKMMSKLSDDELNQFLALQNKVLS